MAYNVLVPTGSGGTGLQTVSSIPGTGLVSTGSALQYFSPYQESTMFEDFLSNTYKSPYSYGWAFIGGAGADHNANGTTSAGHPGVCQLVTNTNASGGANYQILNAFTLGAGAFDYSWIIQTPVLSIGAQRYVVNCGLMDAIGNGSSPYANDGVYLEYSDNLNSGNWRGVSTSGGTATYVNGSVAAVTTYTTLRITINAAATLCTFYVNGTSIGTSSTNIPTVAIGPATYVQKTVGTTSVSLNNDAFYLNLNLTAAR